MSDSLRKRMSRVHTPSKRWTCAISEKPTITPDDLRTVDLWLLLPGRIRGMGVVLLNCLLLFCLFHGMGDSNQQGIVSTPSESSVPRGDEQATPQKKARFAMITIPYKALILEGNKSKEESNRSALLGDDSNKLEPVRQADEAECDKRTVDHPEPVQLTAPSVTLHMSALWKTSVQSITPDQSSPVQLIPPSVTLCIVALQKKSFQSITPDQSSNMTELERN